MTTAKLLATTALLLSVSAQGASIPLSDLGDLRLEYQAVMPAKQYYGRPLAALATFQPNEAVSLVAPYRVSQIRYRQMPGTVIRQGERVARLSGPEVHHFITEFEVIKARLGAAEKRFERNRQLYENQAIDENRWISISESYYALQLEYEHRQHFYELLEQAGDDDVMWLQSPADGLLHYTVETPGVEAGEELAIIVPHDALRLRVAVPQQDKETLRALVFDQCRLGINALSGVVRNFFVEAWSDPLVGPCELPLGTHRMVAPVFAAEGYQIAQSAVFQWQGKSAVLVKVEQSLKAVPVEIRASEDDSYFISGMEDIAGRDVLVTSVSAVQGILLGLGGE